MRPAHDQGPPPRRRGWPVLAARLALAMAAAAALCGAARANAPAPAGEVLRVQDYPGIGNLLVRVASARGFCERQGIRCVLRQFSNGPVGMQALLAGQLEVAFTGPETAYQAVSRGADLKVVGGGYAPQPFVLAVAPTLALPDAVPRYPGLMAGLKGRRIGVPARGSHGELLFRDMLVDAGLRGEDVVYVAVGGPSTAYPALVRGHVDAVMAISPLDALCEATSSCRVVLDTRRGEGPASVRRSIGAGVPLWMHGDFVARHPGAVRAFQRALDDAERYIRQPANFDEVLAITLSHFELQAPGHSSRSITRSALRNALPGYVVEVRPAALDAVADYLVKNGQLPAGLDTAALLVP